MRRRRPHQRRRARTPSSPGWTRRSAITSPRRGIGKPVEIQALWYNALRFTESLAHRFGDAEGERLVAGIAPNALGEL